MDNEFRDLANQVLQAALQIPAFDALKGHNGHEFISLFIDPYKYLQKKMITSKEVIDKRKQERDFSAFLTSNEYLSLMKCIKKAQTIKDWPSLILQIVIVRQSRLLSIR